MLSTYMKYIRCYLKDGKHIKVLSEHARFTKKYFFTLFTSVQADESINHEKVQNMCCSALQHNIEIKIE